MFFLFFYKSEIRFFGFVEGNGQDAYPGIASIRLAIDERCPLARERERAREIGKIAWLVRSDGEMADSKERLERERDGRSAS